MIQRQICKKFKIPRTPESTSLPCMTCLLRPERRPPEIKTRIKWANGVGERNIHPTYMCIIIHKNDMSEIQITSEFVAFHGARYMYKVSLIVNVENYKYKYRHNNKYKYAQDGKGVLTMTSFSRLCSLVNWSSLRARTSSLAPQSRLLGRTLIAEMKYNYQIKVYLCMFVYIQPVINSMQTNHCIKNKHIISKYNKLE